MMFRQSKGAKAVDREWHARRREARATAFSLAEFSDQEITRWDLDTARITGRENRKTYTTDRPLDVAGQMNDQVDVRTLDDR